MTNEADKRKIIISKYLQKPTKSIRLITGELKYRKSMVADVIKRYKETLTAEKSKELAEGEAFRMNQ